MKFPVGKAVKGVQIEILNEDLQPVVDGNIAFLHRKDTQVMIYGKPEDRSIVHSVSAK